MEGVGMMGGSLDGWGGVGGANVKVIIPTIASLLFE